MPLTVYLDDCSDDNLLIARIKQAGHDVISPRGIGTAGIDDRDHLEYAARHGLVLLTHNPQDFIDLHELWKMHQRQHSGILLVYRDNNPSKDMTAADIVQGFGEAHCFWLADRKHRQHAEPLALVASQRVNCSD